MKKRKHTTKKASNRIPPSIPKSVRRCADGYMTDFITTINGDMSVRFLIKKTADGYSVFRSTANNPTLVDMATDISIAPSTRKLFSNIHTLKGAIGTIELWLGKELPYIR